MRYLIIFISLITAFISCNNDDNLVQCSNVLIDAQQYTNLQSDSYNLIEITEDNGCLKVAITYGGGCGDVAAILIDSGDIFESDPPQRDLKIVFTDNDECKALIKEEFLFDITSLKVENSNRVLLNFKGSNLTYLYEY